MDKPVLNYSWIFALRGSITLAFGAFLLFSPSITLHTLAFAFFLLALVDGLLSTIAYLGRKGHWWLVVESSAGIACAILTLFGPMTIGYMIWPEVATVSLLIFIAARALACGMAEVLMSLHYQGEVEKGWMLGVAGALSVLMGIVLLLRYFLGALGQAWIIGIYGVIVGTALVIFGMKARGKTAIVAPLLVLCLFMVPCPGRAGGIALYEIGIRETGTAAAGWAARADDASTLFTNPAGMTRLDKSEFLFGGQGLYTGLKFSSDSRTTNVGTRGDTQAWLPSGNMYYVHSISKDFKAGVGVLGYFGLSVDYGDNWVGRYYVQSATLQGITIQPSVAYKVTDRLSLGVGLNMMNGSLEQKMAINNINPRMMDGQLKISDNTWGYGANLGAVYELNKKTRFGINYLSEVKLDFSDTPQFNGTGPLISAILRNRGLIGSRIDMTMWVPQMAMFSFFHEINDRWAFMGNVGWQQWSRFGKADVSVSSANQTSLTTDLNYKDTWHFALGGQYRIANPWLLFFGAAYDSSAVKSADMTASVPMGETYRFGMGTEYNWNEHLTLGFAYELVWIGTLNLYQSRGPLSGTVAGEFSNSYIHAVQGAVRYRF